MIAIGIPNLGSVKTDMAISLLPCLFTTKAYYQYKHKLPLEFKMICPTGGGIDINRNGCVDEIIGTDASHILFLDSDLRFPDDALARLLELDKDVAGATYNKKVLPKRPMVEGQPLYPFKINALPTGFLLVKTSVFNFVPPPWFMYEFVEGSSTCSTGEDIYFCRKLTKYGFEIWCDPTIDIKHIGSYKY